MNKDTRIWLATNDFAPGYCEVRSSEGREGGYEYWYKRYISGTHTVRVEVDGSYRGCTPIAVLEHWRPGWEKEKIVCRAPSPLAAIAGLAGNGVPTCLEGLPCDIAARLSADLKSATMKTQEEHNA